MPHHDKQANSIIFGYLGFDNYGDELLASTLVKNYELTNYKSLSRKSSIWSHCAALFRAKQVFVVGGLFQDQTSFLSLFYYCFVIKLFRLFAKKVFLVAVGVGPLQNEVSCFCLYQALNNLQEISVRDGYSQDLLKSLGIESDLVKDLAWSNPVLERNIEKTDRALICVRNINDWFLIKERFIFEDFDLLLMQKEFSLAKEIQAELKNGVDIIDAFAYDYEALLEKIASYKKLVTARYHAAILAFLAKTEVQILEVSPKLSSLKEIDYYV